MRRKKRLNIKLLYLAFQKVGVLEIYNSNHKPKYISIPINRHFRKLGNLWWEGQELFLKSNPERLQVLTYHKSLSHCCKDCDNIPLYSILNNSSKQNQAAFFGCITSQVNILTWPSQKWDFHCEGTLAGSKQNLQRLFLRNLITTIKF